MRTHRIARRRAAWALTAALAVALTGCQSLRGDDVGDPPADDDVAGGGTPAAAGAPVLQISASGGFVPMGWDFAAMPTLTLYGDGRAIVPGPQIMIYPGPLLPNLQVEQVSSDAIDAIVAAARDAGLLAAAPDYGMPNVTDVPTTYVTLTVDGRTYKHAAYALGMVDGEGGGGDGWGAADAGLTDEQATARAALATFVQTANDLVGASGNGESYAIEALAMFARPIDTSVDGAVAPETQVVPWPLETRLADAAECTVVDGDAAQTLLAALSTATQATVFEQDGVTYNAWVPAAAAARVGLRRARLSAQRGDSSTTGNAVTVRMSSSGPAAVPGSGATTVRDPHPGTSTAVPAAPWTAVSPCPSARTTRSTTPSAAPSSRISTSAPVIRRVPVGLARAKVPANSRGSVV